MNAILEVVLTGMVELGYAISVHKFQGSASDTVIVAIDFSAYILLSRELLYTALTRAKKHCVLVAQNTALRYAVSQEGVNSKQTHLVGIIDEMCQEKLCF